MYFIFNDSFTKTLYNLMIMAFISFLIAYTITLIVKHREHMKELDQEWSSEEAKEILKLIKDIYN